MIFSVWGCTFGNTKCNFDNKSIKLYFEEDTWGIDSTGIISDELASVTLSSNDGDKIFIKYGSSITRDALKEIYETTKENVTKVKKEKSSPSSYQFEDENGNIHRFVYKKNIVIEEILVAGSKCKGKEIEDSIKMYDDALKTDGNIMSELYSDEK